MKRVGCVILLLAMVWLHNGCQAPLSYYMRDEVFPQDTTTLIALSPVLLPLYAVFFVVDLTIVNPVRGASNVPAAVGAVWDWGSQSSTVAQVALVPVQVIATPGAALGAVLFSEQFAKSEPDSSRILGSPY